MKILGFIVLLALISFIMLFIRPVPPTTEANCITIQGVVDDIYEAGTKDIVFRLKDNNQQFYINRGYEKLASVECLLDKNVIIKYPKYWTPLDPKNSTRHLSYLEYDDEIVYSEIKK